MMKGRIHLLILLAICMVSSLGLNAQQPVRPANPLTTYSRGLEGKNIALWQSHGFYFENKLNRWEWQRARVHQTVEDLYTQSYVLPYLVPMLENSGAYLFLPRERDCSTLEYIVDNDPSKFTRGTYKEEGAEWQDGGIGFGYAKDVLMDNDNPFTMGTSRMVKSEKNGQQKAFWEVSVSSDSEHAVYIAYRSTKKSAKDALYTVHHAGGSESFYVDQSIGGGTWIYLGTFPFAANKAGQGVELSNKSSKAGRWVSADAIKVGGGMGNVARAYPDSLPRTGTLSIQKQAYQLSGRPRFTEAARYWLQWAGVPMSVYSKSNGTDDYKDDYQCRGYWVNWLAGGTKQNKKEEGLNIPITLSLAFHSDAGTLLGDSIVGTLGIYNTKWNNGKYPDGRSRKIARKYASMITESIINDVKALHAPEWVSRNLWDRQYSEATHPVVPSMLLELLSHQNFPDMRYGLDPEFRFTVSRAIYKGMLRFIAEQDGRPYVVQPLPVKDFNINLKDGNRVILSWKATEDKLEPSAMPTKYILHTSINEAPFDKGVIVAGESIEQVLEPGNLYRYKVIAVNDGGQSFPSEILAAGIPKDKSYGTVLVVNGFTRVSAPDWFDLPESNLAGFLTARDGGVPYIKDISYTGAQKVFDRRLPWVDDDDSGFGDSRSDYETMVIAGNTFDYPSVHGKALLAAGYTFVSSSRSFVEQNTDLPLQYDAIDLILGKQKQTYKGPKDGRAAKYKALPIAMRSAIEKMANANKGILISGAYVASDLWKDDNAVEAESGQKFAKEVLHYFLRSERAAVTGAVKGIQNNIGMQPKTFYYNSNLSGSQYVVESPDGIEPTKGAETLFRYGENNLSAGVAYNGGFRSVVIGFPLESIKSEDTLAQLMRELMDFIVHKESR